MTDKPLTTSPPGQTDELATAHSVPVTVRTGQVLMLRRELATFKHGEISLSGATITVRFRGKTSSEDAWVSYGLGGLAKAAAEVAALYGWKDPGEEEK